MGRSYLWPVACALTIGCSPVYTATDGGPIEEDAGALEDAATAEAAAPDGTVPVPDGAIADASDGAIAPPRLRVFVTTALYRGSALGAGAGGPIAEADRLCNTAARDFGIGGSYIAWLNTSKSSMRDRLASNGPWFDGKRERLVFARHPRNGQGPEIPVPQPDGKAAPDDWRAWTGSDNSGGVRPTCADWTSQGENGRFGRVSDLAYWADENEQPCGAYYAHLYCFETD